MSKIVALFKSVYLNATVRKDVRDLVKVVVGVVLAHFGLKYS